MTCNRDGQVKLDGGQCSRPLSNGSSPELLIVSAIDDSRLCSISWPYAIPKKVPFVPTVQSAVQ